MSINIHGRFDLLNFSSLLLSFFPFIRPFGMAILSGLFNSTESNPSESTKSKTKSTESKASKFIPHLRSFNATSFSTLRLGVLGITIILSIIVLGITAHLTNLTTKSLGRPAPAEALALATAVLTLVFVPAMIIVDKTHKGTFFSMVVTELVVLGILCALWLATGAESAVTFIANFPDGCGPLSDFPNVFAVCKELQTVEAFSFINAFILLGYWSVLSICSLKAVPQCGQPKIWFTGVSEAGFFSDTTDASKPTPNNGASKSTSRKATFISTLRMGVLGITIIFSIIVLGIAVYLTNMTIKVLGQPALVEALAVATAVLTVVFIPGMLVIDKIRVSIDSNETRRRFIIDMIRKGTFSSMVVTELVGLGTMCALWFTTGAESAVTFKANFPAGCGALSEFPKVLAVCKELQTVEAFGFLNGSILLGYWCLLFVCSIKAAKRGQKDIWFTSVSNTGFLSNSSDAGSKV
ncbi:hypothetical protein D9758_007412 [Tetrapyrgos nigripes]|uniref:Uncharacterized protein n=1 Tax=Tetrapyrgos nigripes TaxID=182062 RepID=A0A8H5BS09_9AGAR|nr:hypothetical protein D9758_017946 [Tetrapyrgos nigripes]KAF5357596.1 hypothetical protein D9758_007412 [Tetrapyrgos nigripes]